MPEVRPRRPARALIGLAITATAALGATAAPASAEVLITTPTPTSMKVQTTTGEAVAIACLDSKVRVSDIVTEIGCSSLERLDVVGDAFPNLVDLSAVGSDFPNLGPRVVSPGQGADSLIGSPGNDTMLGGGFGDGDDAMDGREGDDAMQWGAYAGNDTFEGGDGIDTFRFFGNAANDAGRLIADGRRLRFELQAPTTAVVDLGTSTEKAALLGLGGDDTFRAPPGPSTLIETFQEGAEGNDSLDGGDVVDVLRGGPGDDRLHGDDGDDRLRGDQGDDTFSWATGSERDEIEGGPGVDTITASGGRGDDTWTVTAAPLGRVKLDAGGAVPSGVDAGAVEHLHADSGPGDDVLTGSDGLGALIAFAQFGGAGNDVLTGGDGDDEQVGGPGNDRLAGAGGDDTLEAGDGVLDTVACDEGSDLAYADPIDRISDCETVKLAPGTPLPARAGS